jgi:hypothetical protein
MSRSDSEAIVRIVNQVHPDHARYLQIEGLTHGFTINDKFYEEGLHTVMAWIKEQLAAK